MRKTKFIYKRKVLHKDANTEIILITWPKGSVSLPHDHGISSGCIAVVEGSVFHDVFSKKTKKFLKSEKFDAGSFLKETPDIIHIMGNTSKAKIAKTIHMYSPPLKMTAYKKEVLRYV